MLIFIVETGTVWAGGEREDALSMGWCRCRGCTLNDRQQTADYRRRAGSGGQIAGGDNCGHVGRWPGTDGIVNAGVGG